MPIDDWLIPATDAQPGLDSTRQAESGPLGDAAVSPKGALAAMQVMPSTGRDPGYGIRPAADSSPQELDRVGNEYYQHLLAHYGDPTLAHAAYNAGPRRVDNWLQQFGDPRKGQISSADFVKQIPAAETRTYIQRTAAIEGTQPKDDWVVPGGQQQHGADDWAVPAETKETPTTGGALLRGAERGILPAAAGMAGFGAGAEAGAALGALTGPFAPVAVPVGGLVGGAAGAYLGALGAGKAQEAGLAALPESAQSVIGQSQAQQKADIAAHPYAAQIGELAPNLAMMRPGAIAQAVPEGASAMRRLMASPWTARGVGAGVGAAQEAAGEAVQGQPIDPESVAIAGGAGALMNRETALGRRMASVGELPFTLAKGKLSSVASGQPDQTGMTPAQTVQGAKAALAQPAPTGAAGTPAAGETIGLKFPNAPSRRATVEGYFDNGQSVAVRFEDGSRQHYLTNEVMRDRTEAPPPTVEPDRGVEPTAGMTEADWQQHLAGPPPIETARPASTPTLPGQAEAVRALRAADLLEQQAKGPGALTDDARADMMTEAARLRRQYGAPQATVQDNAATAVARNQARLGELGAAPVRQGPAPVPGAPTTQILGQTVERAPAAPLNVTPESEAATAAARAARAAQDQQQLRMAAARAQAASGPTRNRFGQPMSLAEFIARNGGIADLGGELTATNLDRWHVGQPFMPRLVRDDGLTPHHAREMAEQAHYLPEGSSDEDLLERLQDDAQGRRVWSDRDLTQVLADREQRVPLEQQAKPYAEQVRDRQLEEAYRLGIHEPESFTPAELADEIAERQAIIDEGAGEGPGRLEEDKRVDFAPNWRDGVADFERHASTFPAASPHQTARTYVIERGAVDGNEHIVVVDSNGRVVGAGTSGLHNAVDWPATAAATADNVLTVHHNHPGGRALSGVDMAQGAYQGIGWTFAHMHDGEFSASRINPDVLANRSVVPSHVMPKAIQKAYEAARDQVMTIVGRVYEAGEIGVHAANTASSEIIAHALDRAGVIDYVGTRDPASMLPEGVYDHALRAATNSARMSGTANGILKGIARRPDRPAGDIRPEQGMESIFGDAAAASREEPPAGAVGDRGRPTDVGPPPQGRGLTLREEDPAEEFGRTLGGVNPAREAPISPTPDAPATAPQGREYFDNVAQDIAAASGGTPVGTVARTLEQQLPIGMGRQKELGLVEQSLIRPRVLAAMDQRFARFYGAWQAMKDTANRLSHNWSDMVQPLARATSAQQQKVFAAAELARLQGAQILDDGRSIVLRNTDHPQASASKPGNMVALSPQETQLYHQMAGMFRDAWDNVIKGAVKKLLPAYEGEPTSVALRAAAGDAATRFDEIEAGIDNGTISRRLADRMLQGQDMRIARASKIVQALEQQRQDAYIPFMRRGDYYFAVKPIAAPGSLGGHPQTAHFELAESRGPLEDILGKNTVRGAVPDRMAARLQELQQQFPPDQYKIEHGHLIKNVDFLRTLDIPAVEKLMMATENMLRRRSDVSPEAAAAHAEAFSEMKEKLLDNIYEEMRAGFKRQARNVPGYISNLGDSVGSYIHSVSSNVADMMHGEEMRQIKRSEIDKHPDERVRSYANKWLQYQDQPMGKLDKASAGVQQLGFLWSLAANPASTMVVGLHGGMVGVPVLGTGIGHLKASAALFPALKEALSAIKFDTQRGLYVDYPSLGKTPAERAMIQKLVQQGTLHSGLAHELGALGDSYDGAFGEAQGVWRRAQAILGSSITAVDQMNRSGIALAAHRLASDPKVLAKMAQTWGAPLRDQLFREQVERGGLNPETAARFMVDQAAFQWGRQNRMPIQRNALARLAFQFRNFEVGYLGTMNNLFRNMGPEGKISGLWMATGLTALGGVAALPFVQDAEKLIESGYNLWTGRHAEIEAGLRSDLASLWSDPAWGKVAAEMAFRGPSRAALGVDLSERLGFGDVASRDMSPIEALGATPTMLWGAIQRAHNRSASGQSTAAVASELMPAAVRHPLQGMEVYPEQGVRSQYGPTVIPAQEITPATEWAKSLGFESAQEARAYESRGYEQRQKAGQQDESSLLHQRILGLIQQMNNASPEERTRLQAQIEADMNDHPGIRVTPQSLRQLMMQQAAPEAAMQKKMPKNLRGQDNPFVQP